MDNQPIQAEISYEEERNTIIVKIPSTSVEKEIRIRVDQGLCQTENDVKKRCFSFLNQAEIEFGLKDQIMAIIQEEHRIPILISELLALKLEEKLLAVLVELITATF